MCEWNIGVGLMLKEKQTRGALSYQLSLLSGPPLTDLLHSAATL